MLAPAAAGLVDDLAAAAASRARAFAETDPTLTGPLAELSVADREAFMAAVVVGIRYGSAGMIGELEARGWLRIPDGGA